MTDASTTVGSITGELRLDISDWVRKIDEADAKAHDLQGKTAVLEITASTTRLDEAVERVEAEVEAIDASTATVHVEADTAAAVAKLDETRAKAATPIVQDVVLRTSSDAVAAPALQSGTMRPVGMGSGPSEAVMATQRLTGANGDLVTSYLAVERAAVSAGVSYSAETEQALNVAVAKVRAAEASKAATAAERDYVHALDDTKASAGAIATAERTAVLARQKATEASADLARASEEVAAAEDAVTDGADGAGKALDGASRSASGAEGRMRALALVVLGLAPALIPIGAAAIGTTAGLGMLGATGVLAVLGIKREMENGTEVGAAYSSMLRQLKGNAHELEGTAASGVLGGLQRSADELDEAMPTLNREVSTFSNQLGQIVPTGVDALLTSLTRAEPLLDAAGQGVVHFVDGLDEFAHSDDFEGFVQYALKSLPTVGKLFQDGGTFLVHFLSAMAPYGDTVLAIVDDALRLGTVLTPIAPAVWGIVTALTAMSVGSSILDGVAGGMERLGLKAAVTAGEIEGANAAAAAGGGIGAGALAIGAGVVTAVAATQAGAALAGQANYAQTEKLTKGSPARKAEVAAMASRASNAAPATAGGGGMDAGLGAGINAAQDADMERKAKAAKAAAAETANANRVAAASVITVANAYSRLAAAEARAYSTQQKLATQNQSLESSDLAARDGMAQLGDQMAKNRTTLDKSTESGRKNREAILGVVQAAQSHAAAINADGKHSAEAQVYTDKFALSLEKNLVKFGMGKTAADRYIKTLLGMPKSASLTVALHDAQAAAYLASIRKQMNNLNGTAATVYVSAVAAGVDPGRAAQQAKNAAMNRADGGTIGMADGGTPWHGTVHGPGNAAADLAGMYRLADGEEVTSNKFGQADTFRPVLKAIGSQQVRSMSDLAAMLGGNRGQVTTKTVHVGGVHLHNPVAVDPVASAENASQAIATYAAFPL